MTTLRQLDASDFDHIKMLFRTVFTAPPWNEDWSDEDQLNEYLRDLMGQRTPLSLGLFENGTLIGLSIGYIKHWYSGPEYIINELCIKTEKQGSGAGTVFIREIEKAIKELGLKQIFLLTDSNVPAYNFYKKNGFVECETNVAFAKML